jgi:hypothetical protein
MWGFEGSLSIMADSLIKSRQNSKAIYRKKIRNIHSIHHFDSKPYTYGILHFPDHVMQTSKWSIEEIPACGRQDRALQEK